MSRVGKKPVKIPSGVKVAIKDGVVEVESKKAKLSSPIPAGIHFKLEGDELVAYRDSDERPLPAYHGLARALAANNVRGVTEGFSKMLDIVGIGFKAEAKAKAVTFSLGYSHPIEFPIPEGISIKAEKHAEDDPELCYDLDHLGSGQTAGRPGGRGHPIAAQARCL